MSWFKLLLWLTKSGNIEYIPIETSLPQAAPVNKVGINKPLEVESPNVQHAKRKYTTTKEAKEIALWVLGGSWKSDLTEASGVWNQIEAKTLYCPSGQYS